MRTALQVVVALLAIAGLVAIAAAIGVVRGGFTARANASALESAIAETVVDAAVARAGGNGARNPVTATPEVLARARRHFARECAVCHANDGTGSPLGRAMFPPVPDLARSTHDLTEAELFHVIENGIRWSGMPAFGRPGDEAAAREHWELVAFIRHLPELLDAELEEMRRFNPHVMEPEPARPEGGGHHGHH